MSSEIIVALIGAAVTIGNVVFTTLATRKAAKSTKEKAFEDGLQCLLRAESIRSHEKYTARGYCPIYAKRSLNDVYTAYHNLGGNDIATNLYNECLSLPDYPRDETSHTNKIQLTTVYSNTSDNPFYRAETEE